MQETTERTSSLVTQMIIVEKYGTRVSIEELARELRLAKQTIYNQISAGKFPIPTFVEGKARYADFRDLAAHIDRCWATARL